MEKFFIDEETFENMTFHDFEIFNIYHTDKHYHVVLLKLDAPILNHPRTCIEIMKRRDSYCVEKKR